MAAIITGLAISLAACCRAAVDGETWMDNCEYGCTYRKGALCQCNRGCVHYHDCCKDYEEKCGSGPSPAPSPTPGPLPPSGPKGGPEQLHLALGEDPSVVTVSFVSSKAFPKCQCSLADAQSKKIIASFAGDTSQYTDGNWIGLMHVVRMDGMQADTTYSYTCDDSKTFYTFRTAPVVGTLPVTIAAVADLGEDCDRVGCGNATIAALAADTSYSMLVHAGDLAYTHGHPMIWDNFMLEMQPITTRVPYMVCVGNHEHYFNFSGYRSRFNMPGSLAKANQNLWYSFDHGGVHWAAFSTEHDLEMQTAWLEMDLKTADANRAKVPWVVVFAHKPLYCSTNDYYDCRVGAEKIASVIEPLLKKYKVDLMLAGHLHNYERSWPVFGGNVTAKSYVDPQATTHIIIGGAGDDEGLTDRWLTPPDWSATHDGKDVGYARLHFENATIMKFDYVHSASGKVADSFTIVRSVAPSMTKAKLVV